MLIIKRFFCFSVLFFCIQAHIIAQKAIRYYYYKGQKVRLQVDTTSIGVITKDTIQIKSIISSRENYSCDVFVPLPEKGGFSYFSIIHSDIHSGCIRHIDSLVLKFSSIPFTNTTTCFKRNNKTNKGLTNRFYVQLYDISDTLLLKSYAVAHDVELLYAVPYMPDWFVLSCSYACPLDALDMANLFFESDLFASAEPEFVFKGEFASNDTYYSDQWGLHNTGQYSNTFTDVDLSI